MLRVDIVKRRNFAGTGAIVYRLPQPSGIDETLGPHDKSERERLQMRSTAVTPQVLLNACNAEKESSLGVL